jgi:hypothetical protein
MNDVDLMTIHQLQTETERCEQLIAEAERTGADLRARLNLVRAALAKRLKPRAEPKLTDHALLRYIERVIGLDIDAIRSEIMTLQTVSALKAKATAVTVNNVCFRARWRTRNSPCRRPGQRKTQTPAPLPRD